MLSRNSNIIGRPLADTGKADLRKVLVALGAFRQFRATMPLQYVTSFLMVALEEGLSVQDYARKAGVSHSVMSRHLLDLGERNRHMEAGFGLITYRPNPIELRKHEYYLTPTGRALAEHIINALR